MPTHLQRLWLQSRGGRNPSDIITSKEKSYVSMGDGKGSEYLVEIPPDNQIYLYTNKYGYAQARGRY